MPSKHPSGDTEAIVSIVYLELKEGVLDGRINSGVF